MELKSQLLLVCRFIRVSLEMSTRTIAAPERFAPARPIQVLLEVKTWTFAMKTLHAADSAEQLKCWLAREPTTLRSQRGTLSVPWPPLRNPEAEVPKHEVVKRVEVDLQASLTHSDPNAERFLYRSHPLRETRS